MKLKVSEFCNLKLNQHLKTFHLIGVKHLWTCKVKQNKKTGAGGETAEMNVSIEEEEYDKACRELISEI